MAQAPPRYHHPTRKKAVKAPEPHCSKPASPSLLHSLRWQSVQSPGIPCAVPRDTIQHTSSSHQRASATLPVHSATRPITRIPRPARIIKQRDDNLYGHLVRDKSRSQVVRCQLTIRKLSSDGICIGSLKRQPLTPLELCTHVSRCKTITRLAHITIYCRLSRSSAVTSCIYLPL